MLSRRDVLRIAGAPALLSPLGAFNPDRRRNPPFVTLYNNDGIWQFGMLLAGGGKLVAQIPSELVSVVTMDGKVNCGGDAFSQVPGHPELFLGRFTHAGTLDECHVASPADINPTLALYKMDWRTNHLIFQRKILNVPFKGAGGSVITMSAYDLYVFAYGDRIGLGLSAADRESICASHP